jgi:hypothetical protein
MALVGTDVSEELRASIIRVARIGELGTTLAVTSNRRIFVFLRSVRRLLVTANVVPSLPTLVALMMVAICSSETSVLTRATRRNIREDAILHSYRRENLKSYIAKIVFPFLCLGVPRETHGGSQCHLVLLLTVGSRYNFTSVDNYFSDALTTISSQVHLTNFIPEN